VQILTLTPLQPLPPAAALRVQNVPAYYYTCVLILPPLTPLQPLPPAPASSADDEEEEEEEEEQEEEEEEEEEVEEEEQEQEQEEEVVEEEEEEEEEEKEDSRERKGGHDRGGTVTSPALARVRKVRESVSWEGFASKVKQSVSWDAFRYFTTAVWDLKLLDSRAKSSGRCHGTPSGTLLLSLLACSVC
jgi:hypothetical protein